jgi:hypothetical protein
MLAGAGTSQFGGDHTLPCGFSVLRNRAGRARHGDAAGEKIGLDHADAQAVADELGLDLDRRHDIRQAEHVDRQSRWHKILSAVALLDREGKQADDAAAVQRLRVHGPLAIAVGVKRSPSRVKKGWLVMARP